MSIKLPYAKHCLEESDIESVVNLLRSGNAITRGPCVQQFEENLAQQVGAKYAICFTNASAALWAACRAVNLGPNDEALVPTNTFIATATCAMACNASLRLMEINSTTGNTDLEKLQQLLAENPTTKRRCFLPVHFTGRSLDMRQFSNLVQGWSDVIIEDAAHALGSRYPSGESVGSCAYSDMTIFSFHAAKNITCAEGGAVTCNSEELAIKLRHLRDSGLVRAKALGLQEEAPWFYDVQTLMCNTHMNDLQAALGLSQLKRLTSIGERKNELMQLYREKLDPSLDMIQSAPGVTTHFHLGVVLIDFDTFQTTRARVMHELSSHGITAQVHYIPLYRHTIVANYPYFRKSQDGWGSSEDYYARALSIPLFPHMKASDVDYVVEKLHQSLAHRST